jgi:hypothetical protein
MGLVVGWKLVQLAVGSRELLGMIIHRLVRQCCGILIKLLAAKQDEISGAGLYDMLMIPLKCRQFNEALLVQPLYSETSLSLMSCCPV